MPIEEKINDILKEMKTGSTDPKEIFKKLLNDLLPKFQNKPTNNVETTLIKNLVAILKNDQNKYSNPLRAAFIALNFYYEKVIKESEKKSSQEVSGAAQQNLQLQKASSELETKTLASPKMSLSYANRSLSFNDVLYRSSNNKSIDRKYSSLESRPIRKKSTLEQYIRLNDTLKAFLSVFPHHRILFKEKIEKILFIPTENYKDVWGEPLSRYVTDLISAIRNKTEDEKRGEMIKKLLIFSRWLPKHVLNDVQTFIIDEIAVGEEENQGNDFSWKAAMRVFLELERQFSESAKLKALQYLMSKLLVLIKEVNATDEESRVMICHAIINITHQINSEENSRILLLKEEKRRQRQQEIMGTRKILQSEISGVMSSLFKAMRSTSADLAHGVIEKLASVIPEEDMAAIIKILFKNLDHTNDNISLSAFHALVSLRKRMSKDSVDNLITRLQFFFLHPEDDRGVAAHAELMKFRDYFIVEQAEKYFTQLLALLNDVKQKTGLRKSCLRGLINLINKKDKQSLLQILDTLLVIIKSQQEINIKLECIKTLIVLKSSIIQCQLHNTDKVKEVIQVLQKAASDRMLANEIYNVFKELKDIIPLSLQEDIYNNLKTQWKESDNINDPIFLVLLAFKKEKMQKKLNKSAQIFFEAIDAGSAEKKVEAYHQLIKRHDFFSREKRAEIAIWLLKKQRLEFEKPDIQQNIEVNSSMFNALSAYAHDLDCGQYMGVMNDLRSYITQHSDASHDHAKQEAEVFYMQVYLAYSYSLMNLSLGRGERLFFNKEEEKLKWQKSFLPSDLIEKITSYRPY